MKERDPMSYAVKANEKTLFDIFGPNASPEDRAKTELAAKQSMDDMAKVINNTKTRERSLSDFFGDNLSPEIQEELNQIGDKVAEYLGYSVNFKPTPEQPYPLTIDEYYKSKDA